jgi:hypothetical protein
MPEQPSTEISVNITNLGNVPINVSVYGYGGENETTGENLSMVCKINNISVQFQKFSTSVVPFDSKINLSYSPKNLDFTIPPKNNATDTVYNTTYWQLVVPASSYSFGECNGTVIFSASSY